MLKSKKHLAVSFFLCTFATEISNSAEDNFKNLQI